jgi:hypothetical protein
MEKRMPLLRSFRLEILGASRRHEGWEVKIWGKRLYLPISTRPNNALFPDEGSKGGMALMKLSIAITLSAPWSAMLEDGGTSEEGRIAG